MAYENGQTPAFPVEKWGNQETREYGISKREYFAGLAMQGLLTHSIMGYSENDEEAYNQLVTTAVSLSDALLTQLNKTP